MTICFPHKDTVQSFRRIAMFTTKFTKELKPDEESKQKRNKMKSGCLTKQQKLSNTFESNTKNSNTF
jgi:hypothetical protein